MGRGFGVGFESGELAVSTFYDRDSMGMAASESTGPKTLSLEEIAAWDLGEDLKKSDMKVGIPALQRGLVWSPHQVELLWDSILRGFPIGSLVVCKKVGSQASGNDNDVTHHLLDGQQRCNAITLGFHDPFSVTSFERNKTGAILWLDIAPGTIPENSTRKFVIRVTTSAHPWGYRLDDKATRLSVAEVRVALATENKADPAEGKSSANSQRVRPSPSELFPLKSSAPIPMAWLINEARKGTPCDVFWDVIRTRLKAAGKNWAGQTENFLEKGLDPSGLENLYVVIRDAVEKTKIVALEVPYGVFKEGTSGAGIDDVEHLFTRLNSQGTPLNGEELAYSMIKAYWPKEAPVLDEVSAKLMPPSRLTRLAMRCARSSDKEIPGDFNLSAIRELANGERAETVKDFIKNDLRKACEKVDSWLGVGTETWGLLPVLRTGLANGSGYKEIYLLLLERAWRFPNMQPDKRIAGLATAAAWFSEDHLKLAQELRRRWMQPEDELFGILVPSSDGRPAPILPIPTPEELDAHLQASLQEAAATKWTKWAWKLSCEDPHETMSKALDRIVWNKQMLIYAQRSFLRKEYPTYDPARRDMWADHDRPWDFDHILASNRVKNKHGGLAACCRGWVSTIGNFRAWPFEKNRSDQDKNEKIDEKEYDDSFLIKKEVLALDGVADVAGSEEAAKAAAAACMDRIVRIYKAWYVDLEIGKLTGREPVKETPSAS